MQFHRHREREWRLRGVPECDLFGLPGYYLLKAEERNRSRGRRCFTAAIILNRQGKRSAPLENEAPVSFSRGVAYVYQPASSAHDRRHDCAPFRREVAEGLHPLCEELHPFIGRSPETADIEELGLFRLHLIDSKLNIASVNTAMQALRFFLTV